MKNDMLTIICIIALGAIACFLIMSNQKCGSEGFASMGQNNQEMCITGCYYQSMGLPDKERIEAMTNCGKSCAKGCSS